MQTSSVPQASPSVHSPSSVHGRPLPPLPANGVHSGSASPEAGVGQGASAPAQKGAQTEPPGSMIGAV